MAANEKYTTEEANVIWHKYLTTGDLSDYLNMPWYQTKRFRSAYRLLPDNPRCRMCSYPFKGIGGVLAKHFFGITPSRMNPQVCNVCEEFAQKYHGGAEIELSILFADVRGSTRLAEQMNPTEFGRLINRFYNTVTKVLFDSNAMVEKLIGDEVTGFYTPGLAGPDHARIAVEAAQEILRATGHHQANGPWIPVGVGVHTGLAYVGAVHSDSGAADIAVLGDTPNIGARLASQAGIGEVYASRAAAQAAGLDPAGVEIRPQKLKGRAEPVEVWVLK